MQMAEPYLQTSIAAMRCYHDPGGTTSLKEPKMALIIAKNHKVAGFMVAR